MSKLPPIQGLWSELESGNAAGVLERIRETPKSAPSVYRTLAGLALLESGEFAEAAAKFEEVLASEEQNPVARLHLVLAQFELGERKAAGETLGRAVLHPHLGFLTRFMRTFWPLRFTTSLGKFLPPEVKHADPHDVAFHDLISDEQTPAESWHADATQQGRRRKFAASYTRRGTAAFLRGHYGAARDFFHRAWSLNPASPETALHLAFLEIAVGNAANARDVLAPHMTALLAKYDKTKREEDLPNQEAIVCYAWSLHDLGLHRDALRALELARPEGPEDYGAYFLASACWLMLGREDEFREAFRVSLTDFYIDTWEQLLRPFVRRTEAWLKDSSGM